MFFKSLGAKGWNIAMLVTDTGAERGSPHPALRPRTHLGNYDQRFNTNPKLAS